MFKNLLAAIIIFVSCSPVGRGYAQDYFEPKTREEIPYKLLEIEIQRGDTLSAFAQRYLNDPQKWPELLKYNKIPSGDPNLILPGDAVKVPMGLVKDEIADIFYLKNKVRIRRKEGNEWKSAELYNRMFPEDGIRTEESSFAKIKYLKGGRASIGEKSLVFLRPDKKRDDIVELELGELTAKDVKVLTASASIDPRKGSEYTAKVDKKRTTTLSVLKGKVDFISSGEVVTVTGGYMSVAKLNKPPSKPMKLPEAPKLKDINMTGKNVDDAGVFEKKSKKNEEPKVLKAGVIGGDFFLEHLDMSSSKKASKSNNKRKTESQASKDINKTANKAKKISKETKEIQTKNTKSGLTGEGLDTESKHLKTGAEVEDQINMGDIESSAASPDVSQKSKSKEGKASQRGAVNEEEPEEYIKKIHIQVAQDKEFTRMIMDKVVKKAAMESWKQDLEDGTYWWRAAFINSMGIKGEYSDPVKFKIDTNPAVLTIFHPKDGDKITRRITTVKGKTKKDVIIMVNDKIIKVDDEGNFISAVNINYGQNIISIKALDAQNNINEEKISVEGIPFIEEEKKNSMLLTAGIIGSVVSMAVIMMSIAQ
jgi:hypothetical protein